MPLNTELSDADYDFFAQTLKRESGLVLGPRKTYLLESRLSALCKSLGLNSLSALAHEMRFSPEKNKLIKQVNDLMTTNESLFFRDYTPFEYFQRNVLKDFREARSEEKKINIWSAACSTGQEPYSIVMSILESRYDWSEWKINILCTDICDAVLEQARSGVFSELEVSRGLPSHLLLKYFDRVGEKNWQAKPELKKFLDFKNFNLLNSFLFPRVDIVFIRNVLIYFDKEDKKTVMNKLVKATTEDAIMFLGAAESTFSISDEWVPVEGVRSAVFCKENKKL